MRWILGLVGALVGSVLGDVEGLIAGALLGLLIGWIIVREQQRGEAIRNRQPKPVLGSPAPTVQPRARDELTALTRRVEELERQVLALRAAGNSARELSAPPAALPLGGTVQVADERGFPVDVPVDPAVPVAPAASEKPPEMSWREYWEQQEEKAQAETPAAPDDVSLDVTPAPAATPSARPATPRAPVPPAGSPTLDALRSFLLGGNTVVRIGILVLTIGVGLLVKYAADADYFPLEARLAFAEAIGLALVVVGFRQRSARPGFGTALQGGGIAAMYLVTFFSYYAYHLLPASLTMALLIGIAAFSSVLAVVQNAQQLAVFGAIGGFLSPVLASSGGGSHVALFSYYALLNLAICGMAVFRSWRILNWTGFLFTFGIASAWGALQYKPENMLSASLFLALFFVLYVVNGTLFALRQPGDKRGTIDTTLTFGTPLATLALAGGLFLDQHLFLALACVLIASVYIGFAYALIMMRDPALLSLSRAYIAVGIGVATLAIPFALDNALGTALAWAAEASGLLWVGIKQQRLRTRVASYLLFTASLGSLLMRVEEAADLPRSLFCALIALALGFASAELEHHRTRVRGFEHYVGHVLFALALLVWGGACSSLVAGLLPLQLRPSGWLLSVALTTLGLELVGTRFTFQLARAASTFALPFLLLGALEFLDNDATHPFANFGWLGLGLSIPAALFALRRNEARPERHRTRYDLVHASGAYLVALIAFAEARFVVGLLQLEAGWVNFACLLAPLLMAGIALSQKPSWPIASHPRAYLLWSAWPLVLLISLASLICQAESDGSAAPLPYLPLLNPLDLSQAIVIGLNLLVARTAPVRGESTKLIASWTAALLGFIALNATVVRTAHHWLGIPFVPWQVPTAPVVQASISILWTILALIAMLVAHRQRERGVWAAGAVLLGAVVVKLFFVDLSSLGGVAKIVTFLAVGLLLLLIGYFAPVPPTRRASVRPPADPDPKNEEQP